MFENQPKALYALALANTGERFGYYTMIAVFTLFLRANFGLSSGTAGLIYGVFLALVYFLPLIGGIMADKFGYGKMVTIGIIVMFAGYLFLSIPLGGGVMGYAAMFGALLFVSLGTGLFKGNLQVMVGNLYDAPELSAKRDSGFSIFYMAINIGALFAPTAAVKIRDWAEVSLGYSGNDAYHFSFAVACVSLIISMIIYYAFRSTFKHVEAGAGQTKKTDTAVAGEELAKLISTVVFLAAVGVLVYKYHNIGGPVDVSAPIFQQFNPFYVVALTPVSMAIFGALAAKGKEPKAPRKIAYGMIIAGCAYLLMVLASRGLLTPNAQAAAKAAGETVPFASGNWLIGTYLILTFGELLLSPMGISFVSKVAPPKYKGAMMGGWFVATAIGNLLVSVGGFLWNDIPLTIVWSVFIILCFISAGFMFLMMKRLEKVA